MTHCELWKSRCWGLAFYNVLICKKKKKNWAIFTIHKFSSQFLGENTFYNYFGQKFTKGAKNNCMSILFDEVTELLTKLSIISVVCAAFKRPQPGICKSLWKHIPSHKEMEMQRDRDRWANTKIQAFLLLYSSCLWAYGYGKAVFE